MLKLSPIVTLLLLLTISLAYPQDRTVDSLKTVLLNPKLHDTTRLLLISNVMNERYTDNDRNYYYLNNMLGTLALKNYKKKQQPKVHRIYTEWLSSYYSTLASEYSHKTAREKGLVYHDKAIALLRSIKSYDEMYVAVLAKASFYILMDKDGKAIPLIFDALKYFEKNAEYNNRQMSYALQLLGHVYNRLHQYEKSMLYSKKSIHYFDSYYAEDPFNQTLYLKSLSYSTIADCYIQLKNYNEAIAYCNKSLELTKKIGADAATGLVLSRAAEAHMKLSHFVEAEKLYQEVLAIKTLTEATDDKALARTNNGLGVLYFKKGDFAKASRYADTGFALSKRTGNATLQKEAANLIYTISMATKKFDKALAMYQFQEKLIDSSQIQEAKNELAQQQLRYNFEKKELRLKLTAEKKNTVKNNWLMGLSGMLIILVLGGYFYYRNNKQKQSIATLEKNQIKQKLLITQMNPHFIFNSIENIRSLIYEHQNDDAVNYLGKFSTLTRQILENSNENYIALEEEVDMIGNYLSIQQLLYNNKFDFTISVDEDLDTESIFLPPMLTQPFIENAIKHGLSNRTENGKIDIRFYLKESKLFFEVTDNGKGFDDSKKTVNHKSLAMTITKERLVTYTKNQDFVVQTNNIKGAGDDVVGAKVIFEIPYIYEN